MLIEFTKYKDKASPKLPIEIHISCDKTDESNEYIKSTFCDNRFKQILPQNISLKVKQWRQILGKERFHDRYLLTDIGGVGSSVGFDIDMHGGASTRLDLLSETVYGDIYRKYLENSEFEFECEFMVD